jgi:hypothetical protein
MENPLKRISTEKLTKAYEQGLNVVSQAEKAKLALEIKLLECEVLMEMHKEVLKEIKEELESRKETKVFTSINLN